ncbi:MAG: NAD(P)/FAD-dependent oxidoreductase [Christensenellaceae bacterium]|nr:NAD(P)/FAD-dependent oxidoreductase [Christensenellaceae bacterium]
MSKNVVIVGAGAAGLIAALFASQNGNNVLLLEKNEKCGKKIYITGKGRCNVTNLCDNNAFMANVVTNPKFLYPGLNAFTPKNLIDLLESLECPIKIERGNRAYPVSEKASDITNAFVKQLNKNQVSIRLNTKVENLIILDNQIKGVRLEDGEIIKADAVIIATGGLSYPSTGSTGDGYRLLEQAGHKILPTYPSLVPYNSPDKNLIYLQGLSLKNITLNLKYNGKLIYSELGEMLFTHFGVSGPLILTASAHLAGKDLKKAKLSLNLKPALDIEKLDKRILREIESAPNKTINSLMNTMFPSRLAEVILERCNINPNLVNNQISKKYRQCLINEIQNFDIPLSSSRDYTEAVITKGGANVKEFVPQTMESKIVKGLYAAGEVLDIDALTGGFNLHIAFITGRSAGIAI